MAELSDPSFIERDIEKIKAETKAYYESLAEKPVQPGQPEQFILNTMAYREFLVRTGIQSAGLSMLVRYSSAPVLDFLAQGAGVFRLAPTSAKCTVRFTLVEGHAEVTIPAGTRVASADGQAIFLTDVEKVIEPGVNTIDIECTCSITGTSGNNYLTGEINVQLDPYAYVVSAANLAETTAGSDAETDVELRERIYIAPNAYSVAGPTAAYIFFAKSAHPSIIDVTAVSITAGQMNIYPLVLGGEETPQEVLDAVEVNLSGEKRRPLCDTVVVLAPEKVDYTIEVDLTIIEGEVASEIKATVEAALDQYTLTRKSTLGIDAVGDQIKAICMKSGVYSADLNGFVDVVVDRTQYAYCTSITVNTPNTNVG